MDAQRGRRVPFRDAGQQGVCFDSGSFGHQAEFRHSADERHGGAASHCAAHLAMSADPRESALCRRGMRSAVCTGRRCARHPARTDRRGGQHGRGRPSGVMRRAGLCRCRTPDLIIDFATLTGAAQVALVGAAGALSNDERVVQDSRAQRPPNTTRSGRCRCGPATMTATSKIADLNNVASSPFAGSIFGAFPEAFRQLDLAAHRSVCVEFQRPPGGASAPRRSCAESALPRSNAMALRKLGGMRKKTLRSTPAAIPGRWSTA